MSTNYIAAIKSKSILDYFSNEGITLTKNGKNYSACCPLHSENTPSFSVNEEKQKWYCYGSCSKNGDMIDFVCEYKHLEKKKAIEYLCNMFKIPYKQNNNEEKKDKVKEIIALNNEVAKLYHDLFTSKDKTIGSICNGARKYFKSRIQKTELVNIFKIGYAPDPSESGDWYLLRNHLFKNGHDLELAVQLGLLRINEKNKTIYDSFRGRLIFPMFSVTGDVIGFNTRILKCYEKQGVPKYLLSSESEVFKKSLVVYGYNLTSKEIKKTNCAIHVEGVWDFLNMWQNGYKNVIPHFGSPSFIPNVDDHLILMDPDSAGIKYSLDFANRLIKEKRNPRICKIENKKDPSDLSKKEIQILVNNSKSYIDSFLNLHLRYDTIEHKMVVLDKLMKELNGIEKEKMMLYGNEIAKKMIIPLNIILYRMGIENKLKYKEIYDELVLK